MTPFLKLLRLILMTLAAAVDQKTIETNTKKTEPNESGLHDQPAIVNPPVIKDTVEDLSLEPHDLSFLDSQVSIDASNSSDKSSMVKPDDSVSSKEVQDMLKEPLKSNIVDPPPSVHQSLSDGLKSVKASLINQVEEVGPEMKLLEQLSGISAEIGLHAEKQVSLAKEFTRLLEELKFGKLK
ncbi:hypothetical protein HanRHA438_Chr17g0823071 [Helianthus annuus]|nr:hypothetical protein HanRHA438_Chr17g0823071 [Helianthus annuus]